MEKEKILALASKKDVKKGEFEKETTAGSEKIGLFVSMGFATILTIIQMATAQTINWVVISAICMMTATQNIYDTTRSHKKNSLVVGIVFSVLTVITTIFFIKSVTL